MKAEWAQKVGVKFFVPNKMEYIGIGHVLCPQSG